MEPGVRVRHSRIVEFSKICSASSMLDLSPAYPVILANLSFLCGSRFSSLLNTVSSPINGDVSQRCTIKVSKKGAASRKETRQRRPYFFEDMRIFISKCLREQNLLVGSLTGIVILVYPIRYSVSRLGIRGASSEKTYSAASPEVNSKRASFNRDASHNTVLTFDHPQ